VFNHNLLIFTHKCFHCLCFRSTECAHHSTAWCNTGRFRSTECAHHSTAWCNTGRFTTPATV